MENLKICLDLEKENKIIMPLSVTVHHAVTEGYHLKVFFEELQRTMNNLKNGNRRTGKLVD